jgi:hypothetical protein
VLRTEFQTIGDFQDGGLILCKAMKTRENIAKRGPVIWAEYESKLDQLDILFKFVLHAFNALSESKRKDFVRGLKLEKEGAMAKGLEKLRKLSETDATFREAFDEDSFLKYQKKKLRAGFRSRTHTQYAEWVVDGMVSAEVLFRVTVFEDFMKHAHAVVLGANTAILSKARPSRQASFAEIFDSFDSFREQQICREVEELDRQSMEQRLEYFGKHLNIELGKHKTSLIEIADIRNKIAHGKPLVAITKDDTTLPLAGFQGTIAKIIRDAMARVFFEAEQRYPSHFRNR